MTFNYIWMYVSIQFVCVKNYPKNYPKKVNSQQCCESGSPQVKIGYTYKRQKPKSVKWKTKIHHSQTRPTKNFPLVSTKYIKKNCFPLNLFKFFSVKIANITLDPDLNWAKSQDPDSNSMDSIWIHNTNFT